MGLPVSSPLNPTLCNLFIDELPQKMETVSSNILEILADLFADNVQLIARKKRTAKDLDTHHQQLSKSKLSWQSYIRIRNLSHWQTQDQIHFYLENRKLFVSVFIFIFIPWQIFNFICLNGEHSGDIYLPRAIVFKNISTDQYWITWRFTDCVIFDKPKWISMQHN